ncbi:MAG TPA: DUF255 domain-containing protein [Oculatellaceae cyanobacterium]
MRRAILSLSVAILVAVNVMTVAAFAGVAADGSADRGASATTIKWQDWSDDIFKRSASQNKLVILDLHAVWCHWCHVMDEKTYANAAVQKIIEEHFIPVSVDQDSRPDLANRYEDYGWPATIIYSPSGKERKLLSGFLPPSEFLEILQDCVKNPNDTTDEVNGPKGKFATESVLDVNLKKEISQKFRDVYDTRNGGWTYGQKFLPRDNVEYAMVESFRGDAQSGQRAKEVLKLQTALLDPIWGGMYQYSTDDDWKHPHFEKIMEIQAGDMRVYSLAYLLWKDVEHLRVAERIADYLLNFLYSPEKVFYSSQDADLIPGKHSSHYFAQSDAARRKAGIPRIDKHVYARENGWAIESFTFLYAASGEKKYLDTAKNAANWIDANRRKGELFCHDAGDSKQIFLGDNLAMARAFLALYAASGERSYLQKAMNLADAVGKTFATPASDNQPGVGFVTVVPASAAGNAINLDENIGAARFFNLLSFYSGRKSDKELATVAMRYVTTPFIVKKRSGLVAGILLADFELSGPPPHFVTVGSKSDATAKELFFTSQQFPLAYRQTEFFDKSEGKLLSSDIDYPELPKAAAFFCSGNTCSAPVYTSDKLRARFEQLKKQ